VLFAGAGLSMSVGLPSWQELIDYLANELGIDSPDENPGISHHTLAEYRAYASAVARTGCRCSLPLLGEHRRCGLLLENYFSPITPSREISL
jgi:hypothetical protein